MKLKKLLKKIPVSTKVTILDNNTNEIAYRGHLGDLLERTPLEREALESKVLLIQLTPPYIEITIE